MDRIQEGKLLSKKMRQLLQGRPFVLIWEGVQGDDGFITNVTKENAALVLRDAAAQITAGEMTIVQHRHQPDKPRTTHQVAARCGEVANVVSDAIGAMEPPAHPITAMAGLGVVLAAYIEHLPLEMREEMFESWVVNLRADMEEHLPRTHPLPSHLQS